VGDAKANGLIRNTRSLKLHTNREAEAKKQNMQSVEKNR
jgi:hypothetical protein